MPPIVPPTMAPERSAVLLEEAGGAADVVVPVAELVEDSVVGVAEINVDPGKLVVKVVRDSDDVGEVLNGVVVEFELGLGRLGVGRDKKEGLSVKATVKVGRTKLAVIPVAVASTVVARLLAVPHPNWLNPPSNTFL
jgi:hypothetical protein